MLFVGSSAIVILLTSTISAYSGNYFVGGIERFFAILLHIGLSLIVLQGVVRKRFCYIVIAIIIHGLVDALIGILPLFVPKDSVVIVLEVIFAITALGVFYYGLSIKRKGVLS